jgi:hypothetical protein
MEQGAWEIQLAAGSRQRAGKESYACGVIRSLRFAVIGHGARSMGNTAGSWQQAAGRQRVICLRRHWVTTLRCHRAWSKEHGKYSWQRAAGSGQAKSHMPAASLGHYASLS